MSPVRRGRSGHREADHIIGRANASALWPQLADTYKMAVWFCDSHSPGQRGQVENLNRPWHWWFPRGTDLHRIPQVHANHVAGIVNHQRRRSLNYHSPATLYTALTVQ